MNRTDVLFTSTGRTGTKFVAAVFDLPDDDMHAIHISEHSSKLNVLVNAKRAGLVSDALVKKAWEKSQGFRHSQHGVIIDSNNHTWGVLAFYPQWLDSCRVIHMVREPRSYIRSHLNWAYGRRKSYVANFILPFWQPNGWIESQVPWHEWRAFTPIERFAWIWAFKNEQMMKGMHDAASARTVRYEDIFSPAGGEVLVELGHFMGVDLTHHLSSFSSQIGSVKNKSSGSEIPDWQDWPAKTQKRVKQLCMPIMEQLGYEW